MRLPLQIASALIIVLLVAVQSGPIPALADGPVIIDSYGMWTVKELGYSALVFPCREEIEVISVEYVLPEDAAQGPDNWYLINMDFVIELSEQSDDGFCIVGAATNDWPCALIEFGTKWQDDALTIDWGTVDLLNGRVVHSTNSPRINVSFSNYLTVHGVQSGLNVLAFYFEEYEGTEIKSLHILDSSGIEYTDVSPPKLELELKVPERQVGVGDTFAVGFVVTNAGDLPAKDVVVQATYPEEALEMLGDSFLRTESLENSFEGTFEFRTMAEGQHEVMIDLTTKTGITTPMARVEIPVGPRDSTSLTIPIIASIVAVLLIGGVLIRSNTSRLRRLWHR